MNLKVRDVSRLLNVSEETVYKWLEEGSIPAFRIQDQYRFNRAEILEWATSRKMAVSPSAFDDASSSGRAGRETCLSSSLERGGVFFGVKGEDKAAVLRDVVAKLPLPDGSDREFVCEMLLSRENMGSTAVGNGVAIPHPRYPVIMPPAPDSLSVCFLQEPVDFGAPDGKPVEVLFVLVSSTVDNHLKLLSKLAFALKDPGFSRLVASRASAGAMIAAAAELDDKAGGGGKP